MKRIIVATMYVGLTLSALTLVNKCDAGARVVETAKVEETETIEETVTIEENDAVVVKAVDDTEETGIPEAEDVIIPDCIEYEDYYYEEPDTSENMDISVVYREGYIEHVIPNCKLTFYNATVEQCGSADGITATGTHVVEGRTIAVDPRMIPLGSKVIIDGHTYVAEDTGGAIKNSRIDIYFDTYAGGMAWGGMKYRDVTWLEPATFKDTYLNDQLIGSVVVED